MDVDRIQHGYDRAGNRLYREQTVQAGEDELYSHDGLDPLANTKENLKNFVEGASNL